MNILMDILLGLLLFICVLLVTVVLMQRSKSDGLAGGAAFGGGFTEAFFGAGTATALVKITTWLGGIFFALALLLAVLFSVQHKGDVGAGKLHKIVTTTNAVSKTTNHVSKVTNAAPATSSTSTNSAAKTK